MDLPDQNANELVQRCLDSGSPEDWGDFVGRTQRLIAAVALRVSRQYGMYSKELVEDLVQDTYVKLCANDFKVLRRFRPEYPDALFAFIKTIAASVAHDHFRKTGAAKRGSHLTGSLDESPAHAGAQTAPAAIESNLLLAQIQEVVEKRLSGQDCERQKLIFGLYFRDGMTASAIASIPGIALTAKGVESALLRITRMLKQEMNPKQRAGL